MRGLVYTCCCLTLLFFSSCTRTALYEQKAKTLDSLDGAIHAMIRELEETDTVLLQKSVTHFNWYRQFIQQNINDTISRAEADHLQHFYSSGKSLENFSQNRRQILLRAALVSTQLSKLSQDLKNKALGIEQLSGFALYEKDEAGKLIVLGQQQQRLFHSSLEEFKTSLRGVEWLIRSRNKGELPTVIKDTLSL